LVEEGLEKETQRKSGAMLFAMLGIGPLELIVLGVLGLAVFGALLYYYSGGDKQPPGGD
jgi:hypothetical protein